MMNGPNELRLGFVLHARPWRETSLLVDVFTEQYGKLCLCAKGVRGKKSSKRSLLQPLSPLYLNWKGRGDLPTLTAVEPASPTIKLSGQSLYSAFYVNELMMRLLHRHDPHPTLFHQYHKALEQLVDSESIEPTLRQFELHLLSAIGYGLTLSHDMNGEPLREDSYYLLHTDGLFQAVEHADNHFNQPLFKGQYLMLIADNNWQNTEVLANAKRLLRMSLQSLLGDKPLQSRKLFRRKQP